MTTIDPRETSTRDIYRFLVASVVPRPIAFVSTMSADGVANLAPFSFFNAVTPAPPVVAFSVLPNRSGAKDTVRNLAQAPELVVNVVSEAFVEAMNLTSGEWPPEVDEFEKSGLTPVPSLRVRPPRVAEAKIQLECELLEIVSVGTAPASLVLAEVVLVHADDSILTDGLPDPRKLRPVARLGGDLYTKLGELFELKRPRVG